MTQKGISTKKMRSYFSSLAVILFVLYQQVIVTWKDGSKPSPFLLRTKPSIVLSFVIAFIYNSLNLKLSVKSRDHSTPFMMKYPPRSRGSSYSRIRSSIDFFESEQYLLPIIRGMSTTRIFFKDQCLLATSDPVPCSPE